MNKSPVKRFDPNSLAVNRLFEAIDCFHKACVLIVGDVMLDHYIWGDSERISPEAPVPVVRVRRDEYQLGGAANVARNISTLGGSSLLCGIKGDDEASVAFDEILEEFKIGWAGAVSQERTTTEKIRVIARGQQLLRIDREHVGVMSNGELDAVVAGISHRVSDCSCIVVSDYAKGVVSEELMSYLKEVSYDMKIPLIIDPKPKNFSLYKGATLITPNKKEASEMLSFMGAPIDANAIFSSMERAAGRLIDGLSLEGAVITLGEDGMCIAERGEPPVYVPTSALEVFDVTGAGDTVIATIALCISSGLSLKEAGFLANIAGGIVVGKLATASITRDELKQGVLKAIE